MEVVVVFIGAGGGERVKLFGVPFDGTASFRPGSRFAPNGIRFFSHSLETYNYRIGRDLSSVGFEDAGDVEVPSDPEGMYSAVYSFAGSIDFPVVVGGEHTVTLPVLRSLLDRYGDIVVIYFDAHADLRDEYSGTGLSHACVARRLIEYGCTVLQVGVRSYAEEEFEFVSASDRVLQVDVAELPDAVKDFPDSRFYITVDVDCFDPAFAPGVGNPEPCGISPVDFFESMYRLKNLQVAGFDVVEVCPPCDPSGITQALAARILRDMILLFAQE